jgi:hypothetical protein
MTLRPKTFESGFLIFLIAFWGLSALCNESMLGRILLGYKSELFPMSTFSVYLHPKLSKTRVYSFEVVEEKGDKPVELNAYKMFYPLDAPDLDDEIATTQLIALVNSVRKHCPDYRVRLHRFCEKNPVPTMTVQKDIGEMWLRSIRQHTAIRKIPSEIRLKQTYHFFDAVDMNRITQVKEEVLLTFHPRESWVAHEH